MSNTVALRMDRLSKKFRRGEQHDSLRDFIPALAKRMFLGKTEASELKSNEFWALRDISFEVHQGESVAIIGHNGAGKSTMLKHLSGLLKPTQGSLDVHGRLSALIEVGAGFHFDLTGRENVFLNGAILGMSRAEVRSKFDDIVEFSELADFIDTPVKRYSSGMFARLGFSVAAHMEPDILIIDEVLSVGDHVFQAKCLDKMRSILQRGTTILFVSHNIKAVADLCARAIFLEKGHLIDDGPTSQVIRTYMDRSASGSTRMEDQGVRLESIEIRATDGNRYNLQAGEDLTVHVRFLGVQGASTVSCMLILTNMEGQTVFRVSAQELGAGPSDIGVGEQRGYDFKVTLNLAPGTYRVGAALYWMDMSHIYDIENEAATIFVTSPVAGHGTAHLFPRLI